MISAVEHINALEAELADQIVERVTIRREIGQAIDRVQDERLSRLLRLRYIDGMTWEKIAVQMDMTYQWVCKLHGKSLELIVIDN